MAKPAAGYWEGYSQYEIEAQDDEIFCDECPADFEVGDTYWAREDEVLCEACFKDWRED